MEENKQDTLIRAYVTLTSLRKNIDQIGGAPEEKYVDKPFILTKLDAILGYFEIIISEKPRGIGFRTPKNK